MTDEELENTLVEKLCERNGWEMGDEDYDIAVSDVKWFLAEAKPIIEEPFVKALARIASNLGMGSVRPSEGARAADPLRSAASNALEEAGYNFYEDVGKDRKDGWFTKAQIEALKE